MKVYRGLENFKPLQHAVVTSGTFDGLHFGHLKILNRVREIANRNNGESVLITFWPHPRLVLFPEQTDLKLLTTLDEKIKLLEQFGIDHLLVIKFDKAFSRLTSQEFIQNIIIDKINTKSLVIGYDHRFGRNREGSFEYLQANQAAFGFEVEEIPKREIEEVAVSSTKIRKALFNGKVEVANEYLTHPFELTGTVVKGKQLGRKIGYPTANIEVEESYKLVPKNGIYAVHFSA